MYPNPHLEKPAAAPVASTDPTRHVVPGILRLPRELRDLIYDYYARMADGYSYRYTKNTLTNTDGSSIDLSLAFTCHQIAIEMIGFALRVNPIRFTSYFSEATRESVGMFHATNQHILNKKVDLLNDVATQLLDTDMMDSILSLYPQSWPLLEYWRTMDIYEPLHYSQMSSCSTDNKLPLNFEKLEYPYSATSSAIRFLGSLPTVTRTEVRDVRLHEDRISVAKSASHARGLISLCRENPNLRVERRVSLWEAVFVILGSNILLAHDGPESRLRPDRFENERLEASTVSKAVGV
jgi:hypothetical protein